MKPSEKRTDISSASHPSEEETFVNQWEEMRKSTKVRNVMKDFEKLSIYELSQNAEKYEGIDIASAWFNDTEELGVAVRSNSAGNDNGLLSQQKAEGTDENGSKDGNVLFKTPTK